MQLRRSNQTQESLPAADTSSSALLPAGVIVTVIGTVLAVLLGLVSITVAVLVVAAGALVSVLAARRVPAPSASGSDGMALATIVERHRQEGALRTPMAAVVIELRGIAADTIVDGPAAWSEPIAVVVRRLAAADVGADFSLARLGPHTFGAVFGCPDHEAALAAAESLVALCRVPVQTPARDVRIDAVAGVGFADVGDRRCGEELIRTADAALRVDGHITSPVAAADGRLTRHARRVIEVETEIRHSLDVDLLSARLIPVIDVRLDAMVGVRSAYDWTQVSASDPDTLGSIAASLGLRRSLETHYLMRSIAAAESVPVEAARRVVARLDAGRLADPRAVGQIGLLLEVTGIDPANVVLEFDHWGTATIDESSIAALDSLGVGVGLVARHHRGWTSVPAPLVGRLDSLSVSAPDLIDVDSGAVIEDRVEQLLRLCDEEVGRVTVCDVDSAPWALELSSVGLVHQCGLVHGKPMAAVDLRRWLVRRAVG